MHKSIKVETFLIILLLVASYSFSQQKLTHEVYFDTDKFDIPSTELSRLLLFLSQLEDLGIEKFPFMVLPMIAVVKAIILSFLNNGQML